MSDSSSDDSSVGHIVSFASTNDNNSNNNNKSAAAAGVIPKVSYTGSRQQPMALDDNDNDGEDDSSASSMLEVLPPQKKPAPLLKKAPVAAIKTRSFLDSSDSDSDDSLLNDTPVFRSSASAQTAKRSFHSTSSRNTSTASSRGRSTATCSTASSHNKHKSGKDTQRDKELEKTRKKMEQERKRQEKAAQKKAEQARKKAERQALKEQKEAERKAAVESRKRQRLEGQQMNGKFATNEIVMLVDPPLYRRPNEHSNCYDWKEHDEIKEHNCLVREYPSALGGPNCHVMQWIRRNHLQGGAQEAWEQLRQNNHDGYTHVDNLVIVMDDPKVFIQLLQRTSQDNLDDDYPQLRQWMLRLEQGWKAAWPAETATRPSILILLHQPIEELDRQWVEFRRRNKNSQRRDAEMSPSTAQEFHDALTWMLIQFKVECMCCDSYEEIWTAALKMTRAIAKAPYQHPMTELECIKKIKPMVNDKDKPWVKAQDVWVRQLQMVPRVSETTARNLIRHYPTIQSLWQGYAENDNPQELVAGCLSTDRYQAKMAESIHRLLTSNDPEELV